MSDHLSKSMYGLENNKNDYYYDDNMKPVSAKRDSKPVLSVHEIVKARNAEERIIELERTNSHLKRMLDSVLKSGKDGERTQPTAPKILTHREISENRLGPPM